MIKTLLFDLDGVLIDLCEFHRDLFITSYNHFNKTNKIGLQFHVEHYFKTSYSDL